jgi:UDP-2-acetamido-3-amino-2,3-dideoxy-glucuronate N-acetyltransferase
LGEDRAVDRVSGAAAAAGWPRVAVVGCGYWGKNLVRNFAELGVLDTLVDPAQDRAGDLAAKHGGRVRNYDAVLADNSVEAVVIATPGPSHVTLAVAALESGKHVYVEKPLAMSLADSSRIAERAEALGRTLMVGHILRYHAAFVRLEEMARGGTIGPVRHIVSTRFNLGKILDDEDVIWSLAPHDLSMVTALLGREPDRVHCLGEAFLRPGITDLATIRLVYGDRASAEIRLNWIAPMKEHRLTAIGEKGSLVFNDVLPWPEKLVLRRPALDWADPAVQPDPGTIEAVPLDTSEPLKAECRHFLDAVANRIRPRSDGVEGVAITCLIERALASLAAGGAAR